MSEIIGKAKRAKEITYQLASLSTIQKNEALQVMASALESDSDAILSANAVDVENGRVAGQTKTLLDRLTLTDSRIRDMADGLRQVAELADPIGDTIQTIDRPNGLRIEKSESLLV